MHASKSLSFIYFIHLNNEISIVLYRMSATFNDPINLLGIVEHKDFVEESRDVRKRELEYFFQFELSNVDSRI